MIVPRYWAEGRIQDRRGGKQVTVRRWGWSDVGVAQAQAHADERARGALERIHAGEALPRREPKVPYNGAEGVPIREEIVSTHGEVIVTRNSYGALCINTPDVLFADVDFEERSLSCWAVLGVSLLGLAGGLALAPKHRLAWALATAFACVALVSTAWRLFQRARSAAEGGREAQARARIARFVDNHFGWKLRVYRTPAGLRVLAVHRRFDPTSPEVADFFRQIGADPLYVRMCVRQRCFRARVSPKPWRIGISGHLKPRPGVWPVDPARKPERDRWIAAYDAASKGYASCRFIETVGEGAKDPDAEDVRALHDDLSRAMSDLLLA